MRKPRSAAATGGDFPYDVPTTCYIEVHEDGTLSQGMDRAAHQRAVDGRSRLFAVWPGRWSSDLFAIDDLDACARAIGLVHDEERTGLAEHEHRVRWSISDREEDPRASYVSVEVVLDCGCVIRDLRVFAEHLRAQHGWDIATTSGRSSGGGHFTVLVRRNSLAS